MTFLVTQMLLLLILAALFGGLIGWSLGRRGRGAASDGEPGDVQATQQVSELEQQVEDLRSELAPYRTDDLKAINGIGPVFERTLNTMGYRTYDDIAAWSVGDVRQVAAELELMAERIVSDEWIEQAAELAAQAEDQPVLDPRGSSSKVED